MCQVSDFLLTQVEIAGLAVFFRGDLATRSDFVRNRKYTWRFKVTVSWAGEEVQSRAELRGQCYVSSELVDVVDWYLGGFEFRHESMG